VSTTPGPLSPMPYQQLPPPPAVPRFPHQTPVAARRGTPFVAGVVAIVVFLLTYFVVLEVLQLAGFSGGVLPLVAAVIMAVVALGTRLR
jgi:hypothetical protein